MRKRLRIFSFLFASFMLAFVCVSAIHLKDKNNSNEVEPNEATRVVASESLDFNDYYSKLTEECKNVTISYSEENAVFNLSATQVLDRSMFEEIDNVSLNEGFESVEVTYKTEYDPETNLVKLIALTDGEVSDELYGAPFTTDEGEIDVAFYADGEIIYLSNLSDLGLVQNCGWFSRMLKKVAKVVAVVAVVAVTVAVVAVAAPVVAAAVSTTVVGAAGGAAILGTGAAVSAAVATTCATIATTAAATAAVAATVAATAAAASAIIDIVESSTGALTINDTYTIGQEQLDSKTRELIKKIAATASIAALREQTRSYRIAFVVTQKFTDASKTYAVGDLYVSDLKLTFDEAYAVLVKSKLVNAKENLTSNADILKDVGKAVITGDMQKLIDKLEMFKKNGYFSTKAQGIYADNVTAATLLATVSGAWIKDKNVGIAGYGGSGGYYHLHNLTRTIHIWYGDKIK